MVTLGKSYMLNLGFALQFPRTTSKIWVEIRKGPGAPMNPRQLLGITFYKSGFFRTSGGTTYSVHPLKIS
jgi:hypothetical protein